MEDLILLVEDDEVLGNVLTLFFKDNGLVVLWAKDGETAIELFEQHHPLLVLLDIVLPGEDGFKVAEKIRESNGIVPIIFMTGTALEIENYEKAYRSLGAVNYLAKPIIPERVLAQVRGLLSPVDCVKYRTKNYCVVIDRQQLSINNEVYKLRYNDARVFSLLLRNVNSQVAREDMLHQFWGGDRHDNVNNGLDSAMFRIRKIIKNHAGITIKTIYGGGYQLSVDCD